MTVEIKSQKSKEDLPASEAAARAPRLRDIVDIDPLQQGQALLAANKKRKKQQKRAGLCPYSPSDICGVLIISFGAFIIYQYFIYYCISFVFLSFINKVKPKDVNTYIIYVIKNGWVYFFESINSSLPSHVSAALLLNMMCKSVIYVSIIPQMWLNMHEAHSNRTFLFSPCLQTKLPPNCQTPSLLQWISNFQMKIKAHSKLHKVWSWFFWNSFYFW